MNPANKLLRHVVSPPNNLRPAGIACDPAAWRELGAYGSYSSFYAAHPECQPGYVDLSASRNPLKRLTRNQMIALAGGAAVVVLGGLYFYTRR